MESIDGGGREGGVVIRDGKVGLTRGLQFSDSFSTACKTGGDNLVPLLH